MHKLSQVIKEGDWKARKRAANSALFFPIEDELHEAQVIIFRIDRIILPTDLQQKVIMMAHKLGRLGRTKSKKMIRAKYWFPNINAMIDQMIVHFFDAKSPPKIIDKCQYNHQSSQRTPGSRFH